VGYSSGWIGELLWAARALIETIEPPTLILYFSDPDWAGHPFRFYRIR